MNATDQPPRAVPAFVPERRPEPGGAPHDPEGALLGEPPLESRGPAGAGPPERGSGGSVDRAFAEERPGCPVSGLDGGSAPRGAVGVPLEPADAEWESFGPLTPYLSLPGATDLLVNGGAGLWVDAGGGPRRDPTWSLPEERVRALAVRLVALGGRHIDEATPCADVHLRDGVRVHAVLPPLSTTGTLLSVRIPHATRLGLTELGRGGLFEASTGARLRECVAARRNILVTGAAGSGKTTLLGALLAEAPAEERIVVIEDLAELRVAHPHVVALEARQANLEGAGGIGLERLLREALRMRPDRLVLGECRGAEIRELLTALNTGHDGGAGTLHANSLADVPARLEALGALAGMSTEAVARQTVSALDLVLHLEHSGGVRRLAQWGRFVLDGRGRLATEAL